MAWRSPFTYRWPYPAKWLLVIVAVSAIGWGGWTNVSLQYLNERFPPGVQYFQRWGGSVSDPTVIRAGKVVSGASASNVVANGDLLTRFAGKYKVMTVCYHWKGDVDPKDVQNISKSNIFDIHPGPIEMSIPWNEQFIQEVGRGDSGTNYLLLLVPNKVSVGDVHSVRSALDLGGYSLINVSGPP